MRKLGLGVAVTPGAANHKRFVLVKCACLDLSWVFLISGRSCCKIDAAGTGESIGGRMWPLLSSSFKGSLRRKTRRLNSGCDGMF